MLISGYSMRSWNTPVSTVTKVEQILSRSLKVSAESLSWPSSSFSRTSLRISASIFSGLGLASVRVAASMVSASMTTAASLLRGRGPS